jgi:hypothetical protein
MADAPGAIWMDGPWFKGNLHLHTHFSDGRLSPEVVARKYADAGYDFIAVTDHWNTYRSSNGDAHPLLVLSGVELDGRDANGSYFHVLVVGLDRPIPKGTPLNMAIDMARRQGAMVIWAHPHWTGNTVGEALWHDFDGLEVYNHGCQSEIGKGYAGALWDEMLEIRPEFLGIAVDDAHFLPESMFWQGGWVMVNADRCETSAVVNAIRAGRFYSTQGPLIHSLSVCGGKVRVRTGPVRTVRLVGPRHHGRWVHADNDFCEASFDLPGGWGYWRLETEDAAGKRAWTNPFTETI